MAECQGLERRLRDITADFFRSKLSVQPQAVQVVRRKECILVRVRGVLSRADEARAGHSGNWATRQAHYEHVLEKLWPMLAAVVEEASGQVLGERRLALDLGRSACVYHLRLRSDVRRGQTDAAAAAQSGEKVP
jgi:hypothetical protein